MVVAVETLEWHCLAEQDYMNVGEELQQGQHAYALKQAWYWDACLQAPVGSAR